MKRGLVLVVLSLLSSGSFAAVCEAKKVNHTLGAGESLSYSTGLGASTDPQFRLSSSGNKVVYTIYRNNKAKALYSSDVNTGEVGKRLTHVMPDNEQLTGIWQEDIQKDRIIYSTITTGTTAPFFFWGNNAYSGSLDGSAEPTKVFGGFSEKAKVIYSPYFSWILNIAARSGYVLDSDKAEENGFYIELLDTAAPFQRVNAVIPMGRNILGLQTYSPKHKTIFYTTGDSNLKNIKVFSVRLGQLGVASSIDLGLQEQDQLSSLSITPDGDRLVYSIDREGKHTLYTYDIISRKINQLTFTYFTGLSMSGYLDEATLLVLASKATNKVFDISTQGISYTPPSYHPFELYSVALDGSGLNKLSAELVTGGRVQRAQALPDGQGVVYYADQETDNVLEMYHVKVGREPRRISPTLKENESVSETYNLHDIDTGRYLIRVKRTDSKLNDNRYDIYDVSISATAIKINSDSEYSSGYSVHSIYEKRSDNSIVSTNRFLVSLLKVDGGASRLSLYDANDRSIASLPTSVPTGGSIGNYYYDMSTRKIIYSSRDSNNKSNYYSINIDNLNETRKINADLNNGGTVNSVSSTPDGSRFIYMADHSGSGLKEIYSAHVNGATPPVKISQEGLAGTGVGDSFRITPDSKSVVYSADSTGTGEKDIFSTCLDSGPDVSIGSSSGTGSINLITLLVGLFALIGRYRKVLVYLILFTSPVSVFAERLYFGVGAGQSQLKPELNNSALSLAQDSDTGFQLILGGALTSRLDVEFRLTDLGDARLQPSNTLSYEAISVGSKYHLSKLMWDDLPFSIYGTVGLSILKTGIDGGLIVDKKPGAQIYIGTGIEYDFLRNWALALDVLSYDKGVGIATFNIMKRFGGTD